jgi:cobalt-zinc-cadmium efflux system protein
MTSSPSALPDPFSDEHHHHHHGHFAGDSRRERRLLLAFALTAITLLAEAIGGWVSGSLALLADAGHMLVDALALLFAWLGAHYASRPADARRSFGYARLEVLVGYSNALAQFVLIFWIAGEAIMRFFEPTHILSGVMLGVAIGGLVVNGLVLQVLGGHDHDDMNSASARLHVIGDLLGSLGAVVAALLVKYMAWNWADPAVSVFVSLLILNSAWRLLRRSAHILLEGVPEGLELDTLPAAIEREAASVRNVHHVHVWQLAGGSRMATLHANLAEDALPDEAIAQVRRVLHDHYGIDHVTVQVDGAGCADPVPCRPALGRTAGKPLHDHGHGHHDHGHSQHDHSQHDHSQHDHSQHDHSQHDHSQHDHDHGPGGHDHDHF